MRDQGGRVVREALHTTFEKSKRVRAWKAKLCGMMYGLLAIEKNNPTEIGIDLQEAYEVLKAVIQKVDDSLPFSVCTKCQGHDPLCTCRGKGWLSRSQMVNWRLKKPHKRPTSAPDTSPTESGEESSA